MPPRMMFRDWLRRSHRPDSRRRSLTLGRLSGFRYRDLSRRLRRLGFEFDRQAAGSHEIWFNATTNRYTTIPNHPGDLPEGTLRAILRQAGVEVDDFLSA